MEERRLSVRRAADRDLIIRGQQLEKRDTPPSPVERQRRRAIRHSCKAVLDVEIKHSPGGTAPMKGHMQPIPARVLAFHS